MELFERCRPVFLFYFLFFRMMLKACTARSRLTGREEIENNFRWWSCTMWPPYFAPFAGQSTGQTVTCSFSPLQTTTATAPSSRSTNTSDASTPLEIYPLYWWGCKPAAYWCVSVIALRHCINSCRLFNSKCAAALGRHLECPPAVECGQIPASPNLANLHPVL